MFTTYEIVAYNSNKIFVKRKGGEQTFCILLSNSNVLFSAFQRHSWSKNKLLCFVYPIRTRVRKVFECNPNAISLHEMKMGKRSPLA